MLNVNAIKSLFLTSAKQKLKIERFNIFLIAQLDFLVPQDEQLSPAKKKIKIVKTRKPFLGGSLCRVASGHYRFFQATGPDMPTCAFSRSLYTPNNKALS